MCLLLAGWFNLTTVSAKEPAIDKLFILAGQSNMVSQGTLAELPEQLQQPPNNVYFWSKGTWVPYHNKVAYVQPGKEFGPELAIAHELSRAFPDEKIGLIKHAKGGTAIRLWQPRMPLVRGLFQKLDDSQKAGGGEVAALFWMQGERDARFHEPAYAKKFQNLIQAVRQKSDQPELPVVFGRISRIIPEREYTDQIRQIQQQVADELANVVMIDTDALERKPEEITVNGKPTKLLAHYSSRGQIDLGTQLAQAYLKLASYGVASPRSDALATRLLNVEPNAQACCENADQFEIAPVNLPYNPQGDNDHYGWPVATKSGDSLIVVHRAMPGHNVKLAGKADADTTYSVIVRSTDGGKTWSTPYDIRDCMQAADRNRGGMIPLSHRYKFGPKNLSPLGYKVHLNAIGTLRDGAVILVSNHGVFRSDDEGKTWRHLKTAFREDHHSGPIVYVGPRIIDDPKLGLLLFGHHTKYKNHRPGTIVRELALYQSQDGGESWNNISMPLPDWCHQAEPNFIFHQGEFYGLARNQTTRHLIQLRGKPGASFEAQETNMISKRSVDTSDLIFNPVTGNFEAVQSDRSSMSINLFSISPEKWETADWKLECRLLDRKGIFYETADGFHTGGSVVDTKTGVQHVFFYSGAPGGPAGVFRLTRPLKTTLLTTDCQTEQQN